MGYGLQPGVQDLHWYEQMFFFPTKLLEINSPPVERQKKNYKQRKINLGMFAFGDFNKTGHFAQRLSWLNGASLGFLF